jgi:hypothetical protein
VLPHIRASAAGLLGRVERDPAPKSRPIDPVFRTDSVVLAISVEKDGNLRVVYARIGRCQGRPAWRGAQAAVARPYPAVTCHVGVNGGRAPSPLCVTAPRKKVGASTYSSSGQP